MDCGSKVCSGCNRDLPLSAFNKDSARSDGRRTRCRECDAKRFQERYQDPEWRERQSNKTKAWRRQLKHEDPTELWVYDALSNARQRARRGGLVCDIDMDHVRGLVVNTCPLLGLPIIYAQPQISDNSPTLDRKHPALGYTKGNVAVISHRANRLKSDSSIEELKLLLNNLINYIDSD